MTVKDEHQRKQLEHQAIAKGGVPTNLKTESRPPKATSAKEPAATARKIPTAKEAEEEIHQLAVVGAGEHLRLKTRGRRACWWIWGSGCIGGSRRIKTMRLHNGGCVQIREDRFLKHPLSPKNSCSPTRPGSKKIVDSDTLIARVHLNFRMFITQKFRLRGIGTVRRSPHPRAETREAFRGRTVKRPVTLSSSRPTRTPPTNPNVTWRTVFTGPGRATSKSSPGKGTT